MVVGSVISELDEDTSLKVMTDQVTQASLLGRQPRGKALQGQLCKNSFKAEACSFLWNETCRYCKIF